MHQFPFLCMTYHSVLMVYQKKNGSLAVFTVCSHFVTSISHRFYDSFRVNAYRSAVILEEL